jgi:glycosyltransferase involved in cell wall biosynthesis
VKIIVATTFEPFLSGGDGVIVDSLEEMLVRAGHEVETFRFPFRPWYPEMLDQMLALRLFDITQACDRLIAIRTPSYLLRHPNKVLWFIHHHRSAYDFWGTPYGDLPDTPEGRRYRRAIMSADAAAFAESRRIFTNSRVVSERLEKFNHVSSEVLYPPLLNPERYVHRDYGDFMLYLGRIVRHKRQHLAIEALAHTRTPVRLTIAGPAQDPAYLAELEALAARHRVKDRLVLLPQWISDSQKLDLLANCRAALYLPWDEDSYGYAALEAQQTSKAVITTSDSGGLLELIEDRVNGYVVKPDAKSIAAAMDSLYTDRALAIRLGTQGHARIASLGISWESVLPRLLT